MKTMRRVFFVLSTVLGVVWMTRPAVAQTCGWSALGNGIGHYAGWIPQLFALAVFDDAVFPAPPTPALYAAGEFSTAGTLTEIHRIAKWNGTAWSALGGGLNSTTYALTVFDDGTGRALYAGGYFTEAGGAPANHVAKWNGTAWSPLGVGINQAVRALTVFDDGTGPALYAGGQFTAAGGGPGNYVAKWNGTAWSALGSGLTDVVWTLTVFDDGTGPALYAGGGNFTGGGSFTAKWNGAEWSALGGTAGGPVRALTVFDDGTGPALYAGGPTGIGKWDGTQWSSVGGLSVPPLALSVFDDLTGLAPALYAGGQFPSGGGVPFNNLAKWDGTKWSVLGGGVTSAFPFVIVNALTDFDDGTGPGLYAGGFFNAAGGAPANNIARWRCTVP